MDIWPSWHKALSRTRKMLDFNAMHINAQALERYLHASFQTSKNTRNSTLPRHQAWLTHVKLVDISFVLFVATCFQHFVLNTIHSVQLYPCSSLSRGRTERLQWKEKEPPANCQWNKYAAEKCSFSECSYTIKLLKNSYERFIERLLPQNQIKTSIFWVWRRVLIFIRGTLGKA